MKFALSYSGGKDCILALHRMILQGNDLVSLISTVNPVQQRSWFHGIPVKLLKKVSESLNTPLILCECEPESYTEMLETGIQKAKEAGDEAMVFGDIDIDDHKSWNTRRCEKFTLKAIFPLWQEDREELARESIAAGFQAVIKIIRSDILDESFLGRTLTNPLLEKLRAMGSGVCGENGEYHAFVYDGPIFKHPVPFCNRGIVDLRTHKAIDIDTLNEGDRL